MSLDVNRIVDSWFSRVTRGSRSGASTRVEAALIPLLADRSLQERLTGAVRRGLVSARALALRGDASVNSVTSDARLGVLKILAATASAAASSVCVPLRRSVPAGVCDEVVEVAASKVVVAIERLFEQARSLKSDRDVVRKTFSRALSRSGTSAISKYLVEATLNHVVYATCEALRVKSLRWVGGEADGEVARLGLRFSNGSRYPYDPLSNFNGLHDGAFIVPAEVS